jgi:hypothetical protein
MEIILISNVVALKNRDNACFISESPVNFLMNFPSILITLGIYSLNISKLLYRMISIQMLILFDFFEL